MYRPLNKTVLVIGEGPQPAFPRIRSLLRGFLRSGIAFLLVAIPAGSALAETYSIQIGLFSQFKNARLRSTSIHNALPESHRGSLRIEKSGTRYAVLIGRFGTPGQAEALLSLIKPLSPDAFIRRDDPLPADVLRETSPPSTDPARTTSGEKLQIDLAIPANRAWLLGSIREISPLQPEQLGLKPGKEIFRLILQVQETRKIAGYPNLLAEKEGDLLTVFAESNPPFLKVGNKMKALVEYRGNRYGRFFWVLKFEPLPR
jgi:hypothetical protein